MVINIWARKIIFELGKGHPRQANIWFKIKMEKNLGKML